MKPKKNLIEETTTEYNSEKVTLKRFKAKEKRRTRNARSTTTTCPNCLSTLKLSKQETWECTGDRLKLWEEQFIFYSKMTTEEKVKYITGLSHYSKFLELHDKWIYATENDLPDEFNCGYTNIIYPPNGTTQVKIPDPLVVKRIEKKLGRKLTEEELLGESDLYWYGGQVLTEWRKRATPIKIPFVILPSEETVYVQEKT